ncbi:hypothetical protein TIFTF001_052190 [Ficus carica]|uniref:Uncharacterized protein n=1 Tax=Ficus carica TaxID=3494 RepID=A0AA88EN16_FICCA|nr:hypothetical protein TIFTF001_052190 [Ficus carica]
MAARHGKAILRYYMMQGSGAWQGKTVKLWNGNYYVSFC